MNVAGFLGALRLENALAIKDPAARPTKVSSMHNNKLASILLCLPNLFRMPRGGSTTGEMNVTFWASPEPVGLRVGVSGAFEFGGLELSAVSFIGNREVCLKSIKLYRPKIEANIEHPVDGSE